jgi:cell wall-associated NlpC family hydrolase
MRPLIGSCAARVRATLPSAPTGAYRRSLPLLPAAALALGAVAPAGAESDRAQSAPGHDLASFQNALGAPERGVFAPAWAKHASELVRKAKLAEGPPDAVRRMTEAGSHIAHRPYTWGGGHGSFDASGYDCSGSVSYVLHAGGKLGSPQDSSGLMSYGDPGPGRYVTIYSNAGHAWMTIGKRRFDTIAFQQTGTRWSSSSMSTAGYTVRHPHGL